MWTSILTLLKLLNPWVWLTLASLLVISHGTAYHYGGKSVQQEWDAAVTQQVRETLRMSELNREKERILAVANQKVQALYDNLKKTAAASAAATADSLRDFQTALGNQAPYDPASAIRADDITRTRVVVGECAATLSALAKDFDAVEARLVALQSYVTNVLLAK